MEIGRLCVKIAGRDSGRIAVVVDQLDGNFVLIDGNVRRKKCNIKHLEPLDDAIKIKKGAPHSEINQEFKKLGLDVWQTKSKQKTERKLKQRKPAKVQEKKEVSKEAKEKPKKKEAKK